MRSFDVESEIYQSWAVTPAARPDSERWKLSGDGIEWPVRADKNLPHYDHIEQTGLRASNIISYGVNAQRALVITQHLVFPTLRKLPDDTYGSLSHNFLPEQSAQIEIGGAREVQIVESVRIDGFFTVTSSALEGVLSIIRCISPGRSTASVERYTYVNNSTESLSFTVLAPDYYGVTKANKGFDNRQYGIFSGLADESGWYDKRCNHTRLLTLGPGRSAEIYLVMGASLADGDFTLDCPAEFKYRSSVLAGIDNSCILQTPDEQINTMFRLSKIRSCESITLTDEGMLMHSPGGGGYYGAVWANDQCEYVNPFFAYCGYDTGYKSAVDCYRLFGKYTSRLPLPSSIIALGRKTFFAFDRGDASMLAYGAARFALCCGDREIAQELYTYASKCIEYALGQKNADGVITSFADELETRLPSGEANLFTSSLTYDALKSMEYLAQEFEPCKANKYRAEADLLEAAIELYFGGSVEGYDTYRYYKGNTILRSWICLPLCMGIYSRAKQTVRALFYSRLWGQNGIFSQSGDTVFWDRSTLYAFRGAFAAGENVLDKLIKYTRTRLLGEHVPYAVEAWPEGSQSHLSAESGLYCRIFTEGLFGLRPTGLNSFEITVNLPEQWEYAELKNINICANKADISARRGEDGIMLSIYVNKTQMVSRVVKKGETVFIKC